MHSCKGIVKIVSGDAVAIAAVAVISPYSIWRRAVRRSPPGDMDDAALARSGT